MALAYSHVAGANRGTERRWQEIGVAALPRLLPGAHARQLNAALAGHPVFHPPLPGNDQQQAANFAYFLSQRLDRVAHLHFFLDRQGVDFADDVAVDRWIVRSGRALLPTLRHDEALRTHEPLWAREFAGLNIVLDIAIALGERAIRAGRGWRWEADAGAAGGCAVLTDGSRRIDIVAKVADCCRDRERRGGGLKAVRAQLLAP